MENQNFEIVVIKNNVPTLNEKVEELLDNYSNMKLEWTNLEEEFRSSIFKAMQENNILNAKVGKYSLCQVIPKSTFTFDDDKFLKEQPSNILEQFVEVRENTEFDIEKLISKYPEIYKECSTTTLDAIIDVKHLEKTLPEIYNKYLIETKSNKSSYLKIMKGKEK